VHRLGLIVLMQSPKKLRALCALLLCYATVVHSQDEWNEASTPLHIYGPRFIDTENGRSWQQMDMQTRILFLIGVQDGVALLFKQLSSDVNVDKLQHGVDGVIISGFRWSDLAKQVDLFYSDSANIKIPIVEAYVYSLKKLKGADSTTLDQLVVQLRREYNQQ